MENFISVLGVTASIGVKIYATIAINFFRLKIRYTLYVLCNMIVRHFPENTFPDDCFPNVDMLTLTIHMARHIL